MKNVVPVEAFEPEIQEEAGEEQPEELASSPSSRQELPALGETPMDESEVARKPALKKIPETVSIDEYNQHMITHLPFRSWCDHCVAGKSREDDHKKREPLDKQAIPRVSLDYCFLGRVLSNPEVGSESSPSTTTLKTPQDEEDGTVSVLVIHDERSGCVFAGVTRKGVDVYSTHLVVEALRFLGRTKVILMTDGEPSIKSLAEAAAKEWGNETRLMTAPRDSHASNGLAERAILEVSRQTRTVVNAFEHRYPNTNVTVTSQWYPWLVRHSAWLITRYLVKVDGKTPYERLRGREYKGQVVEPFEVVHYKIEKSKKGKLDAQTAVGVWIGWIGKSLNSDEHYIYVLLKASEDAGQRTEDQKRKDGTKRSCRP